MTPQQIELHIEELVLHGFAPGDRQSIGEAVQQELTRLIAARGLPASLMQRGEVARLSGGSFNVVPGAPAGAIGAQVAQAIYGGMPK